MERLVALRPPVARLVLLGDISRTKCAVSMLKALPSEHDIWDVRRCIYPEYLQARPAISGTQTTPAADMTERLTAPWAPTQFLVLVEGKISRTRSGVCMLAALSSDLQYEKNP